MAAEDHLSANGRPGARVTTGHRVPGEYPSTAPAAVPDTLPEILPDTDGAPVRLWSQGTATLLVLVPLAFSPVCTDEVGALTGAYPGLLARGARVLLVSCDAVPTLRAWRERLGSPVPFLSDFWPHGAVARALGGFDERHGTPRRLSVLLDGAGREVWRVQSAPGSARDVDAYADALDLLGERP